MTNAKTDSKTQDYTVRFTIDPGKETIINIAEIIYGSGCTGAIVHSRAGTIYVDLDYNEASLIQTLLDDMKIVQTTIPNLITELHINYDRKL